MRSDTRVDNSSKNLTKLSNELIAHGKFTQHRNSSKLSQKPRDEILDQFDENQSKDEKQSSDSLKSAKSSDKDNQD